MDLRQLRYFVAIAKYGSFSKAARHLHIAQPALSQHVRNMEEIINTPLLHRLARGVTPTEAGERLLTRAHSILGQFDDLEDFVRGDEHPPSGIVHIGLPGTVSEIIAIPLIEEALQRYPHVNVRIAEAMSGYILNWLRSGEVDLSIIYSDTNPVGLSVTQMLSEDLQLFAAPQISAHMPDASQAISFTAAAAQKLIVPSLNHGLRDLLEDVASSVRVDIEPAIEIDSYRQIKHFVSRGLGFSILPPTAIRTEVEAGKFRAWSIRKPELKRNVYIAHSTEKPLSHAAQAIADLSKEILLRCVDEGKWIAEPAQMDPCSLRKEQETSS